MSPSNRRRLIAKTCVLLASVPPYARALYDPLVIPCARVHAGDDATNLTSDHLRVPSTPSLSIPFRSPISPSNSNRRDARSLVPWLARVPRYIRLLQSGASSRDRNRKCQRYSEFGSIHLRSSSFSPANHLRPRRKRLIKNYITWGEFGEKREITIYSRRPLRRKRGARARPHLVFLHTWLIRASQRLVNLSTWLERFDNTLHLPASETDGIRS